jgi:hypothetical protein
MRTLGMAAVVFTALLVVGGIESTAASAVPPEFLPAKGQHTSTSGASTFQLAGGVTVKCTKDTDKGEITGIRFFKLTIDLTGCTVSGGLQVNSMGDPAGTILLKLVGFLAYTNKATKSVGAVDEIEPSTGLTLEVPSIKLTIVVKGAAIGSDVPVDKKQTSGEAIFKQKEGKQEITKTEGGSETSFLASVDGASFVAGGAETTESLTYETATEITA